MVRFGAAAFLSDSALARCFNSSMVRFGGSCSFFSQYWFAVSIPVWCDLEAVGYRKRKAGFAVSIPVWCDLESAMLPRCQRGIEVSIPVWCDLEHLIFW